jgi:hypothetical protein
MWDDYGWSVQLTTRVITVKITTLRVLESFGISKWLLRCIKLEFHYGR